MNITYLALVSRLYPVADVRSISRYAPVKLTSCSSSVSLFAGIEMRTLVDGGLHTRGKTLLEGCGLADAVRNLEALAVGGQVQVRVQHCNGDAATNDVLVLVEDERLVSSDLSVLFNLKPQ